MKLAKMSIAGSLESNDALITIQPVDKRGVELVIESIVEKQFKDRIEKAVRQVLKDYDIDGVYVRVQDRGALDCTLKARMEAAILRGKGDLQ
ncbi:Citrate lyase acyl carrier protein [Koleobacter methoxysyntrophicus]|uniref:Citrate lyase acyl carrier protein n=1 Tax=Koleobacter methoxysyntrophicus TaxID=2751313 RepID=A0A8A0RNW8_9FIRM|nr:citrate lyase acyl carrier protein [Koleobacter methoxysyntrophicus]NPV44438.1 citrate lyase acyl carrier protein [Bacillota bacterium]QSQ09209.1 Citrate lyase acyl carrier protein [Koleobacter methoxysyntrophicus]